MVIAGVEPPSRGVQSQAVHVRTGQGPGIPSPVLPGSDQGRSRRRSQVRRRRRVKRVKRDANTLAVLALVLGKHDETNRYPGVGCHAAGQRRWDWRSKSPNYAEAKTAYAKLVGSHRPPGSGSADLTWKSVGNIAELMNQVPNAQHEVAGQVRQRGAVCEICATKRPAWRPRSPRSPRCRCSTIPIVPIRPIGQIGSNCAD